MTVRANKQVADCIRHNQSGPRPLHLNATGGAYRWFQFVECALNLIHYRSIPRFRLLLNGFICRLNRAAAR